jgi:YidC/Oxa1 family membrane protein insertase
MTDMRRTLLWVVFSMSLFLIWDAWQKHNGHPSLFSPAPATKPVATGAAGPASSNGVPVPTATATATATPATAPAAAVPAGSASAPTAALVSEKVTVTTDLIQATLDSKGGDLVRAELLQQSDPKAVGQHVVLFDSSPQRLYVAQTGLIGSPAGSAWPTHETVLKLLPGERTLNPGTDKLEVKFESADIGGLKLTKTYTFKRGAYTADVKNEISNVSAAPLSPQMYLQLVRDGNPAPGEESHFFATPTFTGPAVFTTKYEKIDFKSLDKRADANKPNDKPDYEVTTDSGWVAMVQHYFATAWLLPQKTTREFFARRADANKYAVGMIVPLGTLAPGASKTLDATLFMGPQEEDKLSGLAPGLELVKDYGVFKIIAEPLFWLLTQLHKILGNWGWSIVGLVVLLKIAFYWLNAKAYSSMAKMKAINPKVMELRERLKDKPQQMQQEMMRIYREEKVNPLGGCLPILVQMPFFIALYWVLLSSVEMRHAPWLGWITDLSAKDPYFILPLLMTLSSLLQTWLNPTPPDPVQARMMWIMPLVFSVMFFFFPAGLVLYWLTNNILSIAQQYIINKRLGVLGK